MPTIVDRVANKSVLVRFLQGVVSGNYVFDPGVAYELPARDAQRFVKSGVAIEIVDEFGRQLAEHEIKLRNQLQ